MEAEGPEFGPLESMSKAGVAASAYNHLPVISIGKARKGRACWLASSASIQL